MKPRSIGIVSGGGGPLGSLSVLQEIIATCQKQYGSWRSYEFPCMNYYSFPYSETMLINSPPSPIPGRELSYCIQQLKFFGMEIIVIPCFTLSSYLTYRNYGVELIEVGKVMQLYLEKNKIERPLVLCSDRTRKSGTCEQNFACHYPDSDIQAEVTLLIEVALKGEKVDLRPLLKKLPDLPIVCAVTTLNAQMSPLIDDPRWINPNQILAEYVVHRSFAEGDQGNCITESQREAMVLG